MCKNTKSGIVPPHMPVATETELRRVATEFLNHNHCTCRESDKYARRQDDCLWCICYNLVEKLDKYNEWTTK